MHIRFKGLNFKQNVTIHFMIDTHILTSYIIFHLGQNPIYSLNCIFNELDNLMFVHYCTIKYIHICILNAFFHEKYILMKIRKY